MTVPRSNAAIDQNHKPTLIGVSTADGITPVAVEVDPATGQLQVSGVAGGGSGGDGAILDGVTASVKASVVQSSATPTKFGLVAVNPDGSNISGGAGGGGTQYTEDVAAAADPIGNMLIGVRRDTLSTTEVSADGDNIALKATNKGQLHIAAADALPVSGSVTSNIGTTNGLALDSTLTNATQQTKLTDGNQVANTVAGDTGNNGVITHSSRKEVTYSLTTATNSAAIDVSNYAYVSVHVIGQGTNATITFQASNDNVNWVSVGLTSAASTGSAPVTLAGAATTGIFHGPLPGRYFRVLCSGISAGTSNGTIEFFSAGRSPQTVGGAVNQAGTWTVQPGNTPNTTPWLTTQTPKTSGGLAISHLVSAATTNATSVKASAGQLFGWYIYNSNAAARKVAFHNTAGTPTAGASVAFAIVIPPNSAANVELTNGIEFTTGIAFTTVTDLTDAGATAVAASDLIINLFYK